LSGLHMHVDSHGYAGAPQTAHLHNQSSHSHGKRKHLDGGDNRHEHPGDQDHDGDKDISVVELSTGASKLLVFLVWFGLGLFVVLRLATTITPRSAVPKLIGRHTHWRPPLRAPPHFA